jgi:hypothetical protein
VRATSRALLTSAILGCGRVAGVAAPAADDAGAALDASGLDGAVDLPHDAGGDAEAATEPGPDSGAMCEVDGGATFVCGKLCAPKTCADFPADCVQRRYYDGCCATITCPADIPCGAGLSCCGAGSCLGTCPTVCLPRSCSDPNGVPASEACGTSGDGCGGLLQCGSCSGGRACASGFCETTCP